MEAIIDTVRMYSSAAPIAVQWDELADRIQAAPFLWSGWAQAWLDAFGAEALRICTAWRDQRLVGLLPVLVRGPSVASPTNDQTPLFGPLALDATAAGTLASAMVTERPHRAELGHLDRDDPVTAAYVAALRELRYRPVVRQTLWPPFTDLGGEWDGFAKRISKNRRKALRRSERRLRELGDLQVDIQDGRQDLDALLDEGFRVEGSGWKGREGTAIASSPAMRRFYTSVARWAAARGWLRLVFLRLDQRAIAFEFVLRHNDVIYDLKGGYDETYRKWGPGIWLMHTMVRRAFDDGARYIEWLGTDDPYKLEVSDGVREHLSATWYGPTARGTITYAVRALERGVRVEGRRLLREHLPAPMMRAITRARFGSHRP